MSEEQKQSSARTSLPAEISPGGRLLGAAFKQLPAEQHLALMQKAAEIGLGKAADRERAEERHAESSQEMQNYVRQVNDYVASGQDFTIKQHGKTATGGWEAEVKRSNYTLIMVITIAVAILAFIVLSR